MKRTLLFVDDDADLRDALTALFEYAGWSVAAAADGLYALEWLAAHPPPDVILLDLKMPRCDGYQFRERQLADARLRDIPTVVFTADARVADDDLPGLGPMVLVRKSVEVPELLVILDGASKRRPPNR